MMTKRDGSVDRGHWWITTKRSSSTPKYSFAYSLRGDAWHAKKDFDKPIADYAEAIHIDPKHARAYEGRGWPWATCPDAKSHDGKKAVESAAKAGELADCKGALPIRVLAAASAEADDFAAAVKGQSKAIEWLTDEKDKDDYRTRLKIYQDKKPYRGP